MSKGLDPRVIYTVVSRLIGDIEPVGATHTDEVRKEQLKTHIDVLNMLVDDVLFVTDKAGDYRESVKEIGEIAHKELERLIESLSEALGGEENETE